MFACFSTKQDRPTWPHIGYDFAPEINRVTASLREMCPEIDFLPAVASGPDDARRLLEQDGTDRIDGYIVYQMNNWVQVMQTITASGKPTLIADFPFAGSGGFMVYTAGLRRTHKNMSVVASSKLEDLAASAKCFTLLKSGATADEFAAACDKLRRQRTPAPTNPAPEQDKVEVAPLSKCLEAVKRSKLLTVGGRMQNLVAEIRDALGIEIVQLDFSELADASQRVDTDKVREIVSRWKNTAQKILIDNESLTLEQSARNYLAQQALLDKHGAEGITINCLGGFYGGRLQAYPCLGFVELLDAGLVGACEADLLSSITMIAMKHLVNRPGYISDPVLDTSKRQIIYAHCVAPTKMFGPNSKPNPYEILTHAEDRRGASVRSFLPLGYVVSTMEIHPGRKEILFHRARACENVITDRACRTKLACEVLGDIEKLFTYWDIYGWHRVTFYGDLRDPVREFAAAIGFNFVEEA
ncbi:MAG: hypothetical protein N3G20_06985 [Verrucomicrobiae bacterium]|nr:hypothetical protein [Verrucomicrobiae bacterium]